LKIFFHIPLKGWNGWSFVVVPQWVVLNPIRVSELEEEMDGLRTPQELQELPQE